MANIVCWDHDSHTFRVYSDGVLVLETPLPAGTDAPVYVVAQDPASGLPALYPLSDLDPGGSTLPVGARGDLLYHDGTHWVVLGPSGTDGYQLTEQTLGGSLIPVWTAPPEPYTPPPPDDDSVVCAMARFITPFLVCGAEFIMHEAQVAMIMYAHDSSMGESLLVAFFTLLDPLFGLFAGPLNGIINSINTGSVDDLSKVLPPFTPGHKEDIAGCVYRAILETTGVGPIDSTTIDQIKTQLTAYPNFFVAADGHTYQRETLFLVLDTYAAAQWDTWAQRGAHNPSHSCGDFAV